MGTLHYTTLHYTTLRYSADFTIEQKIDFCCCWSSSSPRHAVKHITWQDDDKSEDGENAIDGSSSGRKDAM